MLFLNMAGSVLKYDTKGESVVPILSEPEYIGEESDFIVTVQTAALEFLNIVREDEVLREEQEVPADIIMSGYSQFAVYPTLSTLRIFNKFCFLNGTIGNILPERGLLYYAAHLGKLNRDFMESSCKIFFLKKIFKIKFPYYDFLKVLLYKWNRKKIS